MDGWLEGIGGALVPDDKGFVQTVTINDKSKGNISYRGGNAMKSCALTVSYCSFAIFPSRPWDAEIHLLPISRPHPLPRTSIHPSVEWIQPQARESRGYDRPELFRLQLHQDSSYTSHVPGYGRWRHRSAVECRRFRKI